MSLRKCGKTTLWPTETSEGQKTPPRFTSVEEVSQTSDRLWPIRFSAPLMALHWRHQKLAHTVSASNLITQYLAPHVSFCAPAFTLSSSCILGHLFPKIQSYCPQRKLLHSFNQPVSFSSCKRHRVVVLWTENIKIKPKIYIFYNCRSK